MNSIKENMLRSRRNTTKGLYSYVQYSEMNVNKCTDELYAKAEEILTDKLLGWETFSIYTFLSTYMYKYSRFEII